MRFVGAALALTYKVKLIRGMWWRRLRRHFERPIRSFTQEQLQAELIDLTIMQACGPPWVQRILDEALSDDEDWL